jgi:hypothetical protein
MTAWSATGRHSVDQSRQGEPSLEIDGVCDLSARRIRHKLTAGSGQVYATRVPPAGRAERRQGAGIEYLTRIGQALLYAARACINYWVAASRRTRRRQVDMALARQRIVIRDAHTGGYIGITLLSPEDDRH